MRVTLLVVAMLALAPLACGGNGEGSEKTGASAGPLGTSTTTTPADAALEAKAKRLLPIARQSQYGKSKKESIRIANAQANLLLISEKDPDAIAPLIAALKKRDYDLITDIYNFYIQLGKPGSERVLVEALDRQDYDEEGTVIALAYYSSGNKRLIAGASAWAADHGASFSGSPGGIGPKWGSGSGLPTPDIPSAPPP